jgi:hypothetical protein
MSRTVIVRWWTSAMRLWAHARRCAPAPVGRARGALRAAIACRFGHGRGLVRSGRARAAGGGVRCVFEARWALDRLNTSCPQRRCLCCAQLPRDRRARDRRALNRRAESSFVPETASDPASDPTLSGARQIDNPTCSTLLQCNSDVTRPRRPTLRQLNFLPVAKRGTSPFPSPTLSGARQIDNPTFR